MEEKMGPIPNSEYQPSYGEDLPGFRPIDYVPPRDGLGRKLFIHALSTDNRSSGFYTKFEEHSFEEDNGEVDSCEGRLTPMRELQMMRWMNVVTDKENWDAKVTMNRLLMGKWRRCSGSSILMMSISFLPAFYIFVKYILLR